MTGRPAPGDDLERGVRVLAVHAHPDDETLWTGITLAHHAARGDDVHVLTATLGEEGEVIPPELAHLEGADGDPLARVRADELAAATAELGVRSHFLGTAGLAPQPAFRDSGMAGSPAASHPRAWAGIDARAAIDAMGAAIEAVDPDLVLTYDATGGYGHPDHVRTHEAVVGALARTTRDIPLFAVVTPREWFDEDREWLVTRLRGDATRAPAQDYPTSTVEFEEVTHVVADPSLVPVQARALAAHATQVRVEPDLFSLSNSVATRLSGREAYVRVDTGRATDEATR